jgi:HPt (histidine-containing phosphotransfer) domain-containing protein
MESTIHDEALPVWDQQAAMLSTGGDAALARTLLGSLIEQLPAELDAMRRLADDAELPQLADKAHQIRGGALYCGVEALCAALGRLDRDAKQGDAAAAAESLAWVSTEVERLCALSL